MTETEKQVIVTLKKTGREMDEDSLRNSMAALMKYLKCTFDVPQGDDKELSIFILSSLGDVEIRSIIMQYIGTLVSSIDIPAEEQEPVLE